MSVIEHTVIGYSGHSYVVVDAILKGGDVVRGYCETSQKTYNPFELEYLGRESEELLAGRHWFVAIGSNRIREEVCLLFECVGTLSSIIHPSATIGEHVTIAPGTFVSSNATVNPLTTIGKGVIINTGAIIEHECVVGDFAHIAPGAVLTGQVVVGDRSFVGANAVVKQNVKIGKDVIVGAGTVVLRNVPDGSTIVGNPGRIISQINQKS